MEVRRPRAHVENFAREATDSEAVSRIFFDL